MDESGLENNESGVDVTVLSNHIEVRNSRPAKKSVKLELPRQEKEPGKNNPLATYGAELIQVGSGADSLQILVGLATTCTEEEYLKIEAGSENAEQIAGGKREIIKKTLGGFSDVVGRLDLEQVRKTESLSEIVGALTERLAQDADNHVPKPKVSDYGTPVWHKSTRMVGAMLVVRNRKGHEPEAAFVQLGGADSVGAVIRQPGTSADTSLALKLGEINTMPTLSAEGIEGIENPWMGISTLDYVPKGKWSVELSFPLETDSRTTTYNLRSGAEKTGGKVTARLTGK